MERIAIIGSGLIGRAWAISFARAGHPVALFDREPAAVESALATIAGLLPDLAAEGLLHQQEPAAVLSRIQGTTQLREALADAAHVQENTPERVEVKRQVYAELDRLAPPRAVLSSSTSGILPSAFTEALPGRARCLVAHPINPPYLVPAVEIVPAPWTAPEVVEATRARLESIGQSPIVMTRELPGFLMNRLQAALLHEAYRLVAGGYASVEDVDRGVRDGIGLRWSFIGPFEVGDLNAPDGFGDYATRYGPLWREIGAAQTDIPDMTGDSLQRICEERRALVPHEELASRQEWRDRRLMALAAHKKASDERYGK